MIWAYVTRSNGGKITLLNLQRGNQEDVWKRWPLLQVPLAAVSMLRKCGNSIQFQRTEEIFSTWRKLWTWLAKAEKVGYLAFRWRRLHSCQLAIQCHWSAVVLVCVPKTLTQSHTLSLALTQCRHRINQSPSKN